MIALLWLLLAILAGDRWFRALVKSPSDLLQPDPSSPWPAALFRFSASLWFGILPLTWLTYALAALFNLILPPGIHPLVPVNALVMTGLAFWLAWPRLRQAYRTIHRRRVGEGPVWARYETSRGTFWPSLVRSVTDRQSRVFILALLIWLVLGLIMMNGTFWRDGTIFRAGYSVFGDFAPHTALVSSFSQGRNWPTQYPHYAGDGISYHFMFFFLCGNLNYLGLPLDWAINLPSLLGLFTFCTLLGLLAVRLTGRRAAFLLTPLMLFLRSSMAFFTYLGDLLKELGGIAGWSSILQTMLRQEVYIGNTTNDSWGLWGVNVYANQRHLLPGLSIALIVIFLFLPELDRGSALLSRPKQLFFGREGWAIQDQMHWKRLAAAIILGVLMPYFHGAALIALLLMLAVMAIFSANRLTHLLFALSVVVSSFIQTSLFSSGVSSVVALKFQPGFIAPDKTLTGSLLYLLEMSGVLLPLLLIVFWLPGRHRKIMMVAFLLPLIFAMTFSLTPDITVNHKYILIAFAFLNIYLADFLIFLWTGFGGALASGIRKPRMLRTAGRIAALTLGIVLMITGVQEIIILRNINRHTVGIDSASPLVEWIVDNTEPDAVFVSAPHHYHSFYLSGRSTWLGHAYYAWSAGHDTAGRQEQERRLFSGCGGDPEAVHEMAARFGIDYLLLDDSLRNHPEFSVDENLFHRNFPISASFPESENTIIFDLRRLLN